jgi:hypothetical protein
MVKRSAGPAGPDFAPPDAAGRRGPVRPTETSVTIAQAPSAAPSEGAWSPNEILAHLRACADVWDGGIQAMIERDHPTLR